MPEQTPALARTLAGGRLSADSSSSLSYPLLLSPTDPESTWRRLKLDAKTLDRMSPAQLLDILPDLSPEAGRACSDFLRLCNPGYEVTAYKPGTEEPDEAAQQLVDAFHTRLAGYYGSLDIPINRLFLAAYLRGAYFFELVLDERGREPVDLALPDPLSARFKRILDPVRGPVSQLGQYQQGRWVTLDRPTIFYLPIDPLPQSPYGRPLASPALFSTVFLLAVMHDLRRVIQQQGYPRIGLKVVMEKLQQMMGAVANDPEAAKEWVDSIIGEIQSFYGSLEPDDSYVHTDVVELERPVGAVDSSSLGGIEPIIALLERQLVRGFKTIPLLFGITDGVSEANANRQWEMHAATIKAMQHPLETSLGAADTIALQAQGVQADVRWRFSEIRSAEEMRDQQTQALKQDNAFKAWAYGFVSHEEAAYQATGHAPPEGVTEPILVPSNLGPADAGSAANLGANPEPGSARAVGWRKYRSRASEPFVPKGAGEALDPAPDGPDELTDDDWREVQAVWDQEFPEYEGLLDATVVTDESERSSPVFGRNGHADVSLR